MPKATTTAPTAASIQAQIDALARQAEQGLADLDRRIAELRNRHAELTRHVSAADAAAAIVRDIKASIERDYHRIVAAAKPAAFLRQHAPHRHITAINGSGQYEIQTTTPAQRMGILDNLPPAALMVALIPEGTLEAWALNLAKAAGCPDHAPPPAELARQADELMAEIENLLAERADAGTAFEGLLGENSAIAEAAAAVQRMHAPTATGRPADPPPPVGVFDADGKPMGAIGGDAWRATMEHRRRLEEMERGALAGTFEGDIADLNEANDRALGLK